MAAAAQVAAHLEKSAVSLKGFFQMMPRTGGGDTSKLERSVDVHCFFGWKTQEGLVPPEIESMKSGMY